MQLPVHAGRSTTTSCVYASACSTMLHAMGLDDADSFSLPATTTSASSPSTSSREFSPLDRRKAYHRPDPLQAGHAVHTLVHLHRPVPHLPCCHVCHYSLPEVFARATAAPVAVRLGGGPERPCRANHARPQAKLQGLQQRVTSLSRQLGGLLPELNPYSSSAAHEQLAQRPSTTGAAAVATALSIGAAASAAIGSHAARPGWHRGLPTPGQPSPPVATISHADYGYLPPTQSQELPGHDHLGRQAGGGLGAPRYPSVAFDMRRHEINRSPAGQQRPAGGVSGSSVQGGPASAWLDTYAGTNHDVLHSTYVVRQSLSNQAQGSVQHAAAATEPGSPGRGFGAAALGSLSLALAGPREHASPSHHHGTAAGLATGRTGTSSGHLWRDFTQTGEGAWPGNSTAVDRVRLGSA